MIISLSASVYCANEPCGQVAAAIVRPAEPVATHIVVLGSRQYDGDERLIPIDLLSHGANHFIDLSCSRTTFGQLPLFEESSDQIQLDALTIQSRAVIQAKNGRVGVLSHLIIEPITNRISHLIMQYSHFRQQRQVMIPIAQVQAFTDSVINLKIDKQFLSTLPRVYQKPTGFHIPYPS